LSHKFIKNVNFFWPGTFTQMAANGAVEITKPYLIATNKFAFQLSPLIYVWFLHLLNKKLGGAYFLYQYSFCTVYNGGQAL
jgi:hypothetical protein